MSTLVFLFVFCFFNGKVSGRSFLRGQLAINVKIH